MKAEIKNKASLPGKTGTNGKAKFNKEEILNDFKLVVYSRQASVLGRKETLIGRANFGIFGDGKELAQIAMAKQFKNGDFRSGYYRDQTFAFATGISDIKKFFAQLYGDTNVNNEPFSAGRGMNNHYGNRLLDENGKWKNIMEMKNTSSDIAPTAAQMQRLLGLAYASKLYRNNPNLSYLNNFSVNGNEVAFGTIGNASTAEGAFFETINAAGVLMVPMAMSIWDDGFGISVPNIYQMTKSNISEILEGFRYDEKKEQGYLIYKIPGWDYEALVKGYEEGIKMVRENHIPAIFHIVEMTQPLGHSTSGSHERYKSKERLQWEKDYDCIVQMKKWIIEKEISSEDELAAIENNAKTEVKKIQQEAWDEYLNPIKKERDEANKLIISLASSSKNADKVKSASDSIMKALETTRRVIGAGVFEAVRVTKDEKNLPERIALIDWYEKFKEENTDRFSSHLYSQSDESPMLIKEVKPVYNESAPKVDGREVLLAFFDELFARDQRVFAIGEDVGQLGDVNQGMAGLQAKYGDIRITDTGIREQTIVGQGIGSALRGLRPIVEIQYLDYLLYALQIMSDDLATTHWRTKGGQKCPLIVRTRGHRLVGIFHAGSHMGLMLHAFRGIHICVPRNMTQAAGFYNTLLKGDDPGIVVERLNAYRFKEKLPQNLSEMTVPLGVPEILEEGNDITIVTYGPCVDIAYTAINKLKEHNISVELIDVRTLLPFDRYEMILESLKKTNRVLFLDEDLPGGATAYMMQEVLDKQGGYKYLDSNPKCLSAMPHRCAYGNDGDYFSKPNPENVFEAVYEIMHESNPAKFPGIF